ncbi:hypothetical protein Goarm_013999 [Gossypium armourianum]|uniref:Uncharacterized protein n=1 Tax=Gossypium armourianum TaxID=34283 RepID=A0A7J9J4Q9_9ROSI|nr:hypothetical protein [Gossypium armourianum]
MKMVQEFERSILTQLLWRFIVLARSLIFVAIFALMLYEFLVLKMSRKFLIGISHEDGLKMLKNTCMVVMLLSFHNSIMQRLKLYFVIET